MESKICAFPSPQSIKDESPATDSINELVLQTRREIRECLFGNDDRVVIIVGPCSVHDVAGTMEYAELLKREVEKIKTEVVVLMRVYLEKPRTSIGWKGMIKDPDLDDTNRMSKGIHLGRQLMRDINALGLPVACEFLDVFIPPYIADLVSWGAIGARTSESQMHRELASGLPLPIGFKNSTAGDANAAINGVFASQQPHAYLTINAGGSVATNISKGNPATHVILRGSSAGPNYSQEHVVSLLNSLGDANISRGVMIDCSHGNSAKNTKNQPVVLEDICSQIMSGTRIFGIMIESNLCEGRQDVVDAVNLSYGVSITDACVDWPTTVKMLHQVSYAVQSKREKLKSGCI